jgi:hypothetical protein
MENYYSYVVLSLVLFLWMSLESIVESAASDKPHSHNGLLEPYDGKPLPLVVDLQQSHKLDKGDPVLHLVTLSCAAFSHPFAFL